MFTNKNLSIFLAQHLELIFAELSSVPSAKLRHVLFHERNRKGVLVREKRGAEIDIEPHETPPDAEVLGSSWDFGKSLFFCVTVVTTIGKFEPLLLFRAHLNLPS